VVRTFNYLRVSETTAGKTTTRRTLRCNGAIYKHFLVSTLPLISRHISTIVLFPDKCLITCSSFRTEPAAEFAVCLVRTNIFGGDIAVLNRYEHSKN